MEVSPKVLHNFSGLLHCAISQLRWFENQTLFIAWFVYMHTTLSKWLSTLDLCITCGIHSPVNTKHRLVDLPGRFSLPLVTEAARGAVQAKDPDRREPRKRETA